jgi:excisionase family DNA binding protein
VTMTDARASDRPPEFMTTSEIGDCLCVSASTVKRLCERGKLSAIQLTPGGHWRIPSSEIERIVAEAKLRRLEAE